MAGNYTKIIKVILDLQDNLTGKMKHSQNAITRANKVMRDKNDITRKSTAGQKSAIERQQTLTEQNNRFGQVMGMTQERFKAFNAQQLRFKTLGGRVANTIRKQSHGMRGFRMEMLGVMFFGMAMLRMFKQMFGPISEAFGIMELWGIMLTVLFLPIMEAIFPYLLAMMLWFMNLSNPVKMAIGIFMLFIGAIGFLLMMVGMMGLGIGSLILMFGSVLVPILMVVAVIVGLGFIIVGIINIFKNWGKSTSGVMKGIGMAIIGLGLILAIFIGWWALIPIAVGIAIWAIASNWSAFRDWFKLLGMRIRDTFILIWYVISDVVKSVWNGLVNIIQFSINLITKKLNRLISAINRVPGINIPIIPKLELSNFKVEYQAITKAREMLAAQEALKAKMASARAAEKVIGETQKASEASGKDSFIDSLESSGFNLPLTGNAVAEPQTNITNNFNGFTMEELKRELDDRDSKMAAELERNR